MNTDEALLELLREAWEEADPVPPQLVDRVLFGLQLADLEYELLRLSYLAEPAGVRGESAVTTVTFSSKRLTVMLMLPAAADPVRRVDGWISPAGARRLEAITASGRSEVVAGLDGRFSFTAVPAGLFQLIIHPVEAGPAGERPLVTPALQL